MKHVSSRALFNYWNSLRGERAAPERGEIVPGAIRHILADTFILEVDGETPLFRLGGTRLCALLGDEIKGRAFGSLWRHDSGLEARRLLDMVLDNQTGVVAGVAAEAEACEHLDLELLLLPLRYRGKTHARMLGCLSPAVMPEWLGTRPIGPLALTSVRVLWPGHHSPAAFGSVPAARNGHLMVYRGGRN